MLYVCLIFFLPEFLAPIVSILAFATAVRAVKKDNLKLSVGKLFIPLSLFVLVIIAGLIYSDDRLSTLGSVALWGSMVLLYFVVTTLINTTERLNKFIKTLTFICCICGIIAILQYCIQKYVMPFFGEDQYINMQFWRWLDELLYKATGFNFFNLADVYKFRSSSTYTNPNVYAECSVFLFPFVMFFTLRKRSKRKTVIGIMILALMFLGILFSFSRAACIALIVVFIIFLAFKIKKIQYLALVLLIIAILIPSSVYERLFSINTSSSYIQSITEDIADKLTGEKHSSIFDTAMNRLEEGESEADEDKDYSVRQRFEVWSTTLKLIAKKPITGYGAGFNNIKTLLTSNGTANYHAHNVFLEILLENGLLGFIPLMWLLISSFIRGIKIAHRSLSPLLGISIICFVLTFVISGMFDYLFLTPKLIGTFCVILGLTDASSFLYINKKICPVKDSYREFVYLPIKTKIDKKHSY